MRNCPDCGRSLALTNPALTGAASKTGTVMVDLPHGPPSTGGTCGFMSPGCRSCYRGPIDSRPSVKTAMKYRAEVFAMRKAYTEQLINELRVHESKGATVVRMHGGGDLLDADHVNGWVRVVDALPGLQFFGTTRAWRSWHRDTPGSKAMRTALQKLRTRPNMALGASVDHSLREFVPWLKRQSPPWNIWNALTEFDTAEKREKIGIGKATGATHHQNAIKQFAWAKANGILIGRGCPQQTGAQPDCAACQWCFTKSTKTKPHDVTFALH